AGAGDTTGLVYRGVESEVGAIAMAEYCDRGRLHVGQRAEEPRPGGEVLGLLTAALEMKPLGKAFPVALAPSAVGDQHHVALARQVVEERRLAPGAPAQSRLLAPAAAVVGQRRVVSGSVEGG